MGKIRMTALLRAGVAQAIVGCALLHTTAFAQDQAAQKAEDAETEQTIIVTGSRITNPNVTSAVPITTLKGEELFQRGRVSVGDQLADLPSIRSTFTQANSTASLGTAGLNLLDLRGLGVQRTLVLVNGRRHVANDILNSGSAVDINQIPADLIERIDITTGGNSSIYGSDAIAGVVNFVLKQDYDGLQIRAQNGISSHGDAGNYYISGLAGKNFAEGRGNITFSGEYSLQNQYFGGNRDYYKQSSGFVTVDSDPSGALNGSDGVPDRKFYQGLTSTTLSSAGNVILCCSAGGYVNPYIFDPNGTLVPLTGTRVGLAPYGSLLNANRSDNLRNAGQLQLLPRNERYNFNLMGHFTVSDAFEPFFEAKYVRVNTRGTGFSGPAFTQQGSTLGSPREHFSTSNPYLNPQAADVIRAGYGDYYDAEGSEGSDGVNDADQFGFTIWKNLLDLGVREERAKRETYRLVGGVRGTFNTDWKYELSANYGEFKEKTRVGGNVNAQRYLLAIDAVDQGLATTGVANGNIVCRSQVNPSAAVAYESAGDPAYAAAHLADDVAKCVPVNLFGEGKVTDAARKYITQDTTSIGKITQLVINGYMSGDTSGFLELPGGPVSFAVGAEYRRETNYFTADPLIQAGMTFYNALPTFKSPAFEVKEAFGELQVPILKDRPFFNELSISAAGRIADYKGATGRVFAWNAGGVWAPIPDIRFRGSYSRAVRAPSLSELYSTLGQNFATINDPCSERNLASGTSTRETNCRAAGVPTGYDYVYIQSLEILSGGNTELREEKSRSIVLGGIIQPRFVPGLSISVDYYNIKVDNVITSPSAQQILDACYDAASLDNQFCNLIQRQGAGEGPRGEQTGRILEGTLAVTPLNYAALKTRGIDVDASYTRDFPGFATVSSHLIYNHVFQNDQYLDPVDPKRADQFLKEMGDPADQFIWTLDVKRGPVTLGYKLRYIGKQLAISTAEYEFFFSKQGRPPQNTDFSDPIWSPDIFYHNVRVDVELNKQFNFYLGVDNLTDRMPPFHNTGIGDGSAIWDNVGRSFYAGVVAKF